MAAKILNFPMKQSQDEEIEDQYDTYFANKVSKNYLKSSIYWIPIKEHPNSTSRNRAGFMQFILLIITVVAILLLCFLKGHHF